MEFLAPSTSVYTLVTSCRTMRLAAYNHPTLARKQVFNGDLYSDSSFAKHFLASFERSKEGFTDEILEESNCRGVGPDSALKFASLAIRFHHDVVWELNTGEADRMRTCNQISRHAQQVHLYDLRLRREISHSSFPALLPQVRTSLRQSSRLSNDRIHLRWQVVCNPHSGLFAFMGRAPHCIYPPLSLPQITRENAYHLAVPTNDRRVVMFDRNRALISVWEIVQADRDPVACIELRIRRQDALVLDAGGQPCITSDRIRFFTDDTLIASLDGTRIDTLHSLTEHIYHVSNHTFISLPLRPREMRGLRCVQSRIAHLERLDKADNGAPSKWLLYRSARTEPTWGKLGSTGLSTLTWKDDADVQRCSSQPFCPGSCNLERRAPRFSHA
ncbi:hypothetical protein K437DRAFT_127172 [Tilletiaria anomala UBC 951]|uniref:Uncharacterized protein n=1 Tax=Tilletiaria anomala (strain ATCC 24038 / CBS 436.72 / UBC 951) TaxID=1037660 RepID=A0A066VTA0_TILAU|nr:uncharacterized protein K437DRAFT_127172 [Tilletiaria anomala UBC 951]KDN44932.1 hypothetical protein K437DRAFT_127172 [Tilletiaria anomala UBC 951]